MKKKGKNIIPREIIENKILLLREQKVMLDSDLAELYGVETKALNRAVKRNLDRFPSDFMFKLTKKEKNKVVPIWHHLGKLKYSYQLPYAFTEQGIAMLSSVLSSKRAVYVNIQIMRTFTRLKQILLTHKDLQLEIEKLHKKYSKHDEDIQAIFSVIKQWIIEKQKPKNKIGFCRE